MKLVVTGANGFVGKSLCNKLVENQHMVIACMRAVPTLTVDTPNISYIDYRNIYQHLKHTDAVIHLAGRAHIMSDTVDNPYLAYKEVNVTNSIQLAKQAIDAGIKRFIFISSIKVIGEESHDSPYSERDECLPSDDYGKTKLEAEDALKDIFNNTTTQLIIIRPPLIYGPEVKANFKKLITLCNTILPLPLGTIDNKRSLIYLENLIDFIELCCHHPKAINQTFLISDDFDISTTILIKTIKKALKKPAVLFPVPHYCLVRLLKKLGKESLAQRLCGNLQVDISKAKRLLNWQPKFTFEEGIKKTIDAYLKIN